MVNKGFDFHEADDQPPDWELVEWNMVIWYRADAVRGRRMRTMQAERVDGSGWRLTTRGDAEQVLDERVLTDDRSALGWIDLVSKALEGEGWVRSSITLKGEVA